MKDIERALVATVVARLRPSDFAFTVRVRGLAWDVYRFVYASLPGTIAIRIDDGKTLVGLFVMATYTEEVVVQQLEQRRSATTND
jgi:hypothetical protein